MLRYCKLSSVTVLQEILVIVSNVSIVSSVSVANNMWYLKKSTLKNRFSRKGLNLFCPDLDIFSLFYERVARYTYMLTIPLNLDRTSHEIKESDSSLEGDVGH